MSCNGLSITVVNHVDQALWETSSLSSTMQWGFLANLLWTTFFPHNNLPWESFMSSLCEHLHLLEVIGQTVSDKALPRIWRHIIKWSSNTSLEVIYCRFIIYFSVVGPTNLQILFISTTLYNKERALSAKWHVVSSNASLRCWNMEISLQLYLPTGTRKSEQSAN